MLSRVSFKNWEQEIKYKKYVTVILDLFKEKWNFLGKASV